MARCILAQRDHIYITTPAYKERTKECPFIDHNYKKFERTCVMFG